MDKTSSGQLRPRLIIRLITSIILICCALFTVNCASPTNTPPSIVAARDVLPSATSTTPAQTDTDNSATELASPPTILYFRTGATESKPGETVTLEWASSGADTATIQRILPSGQLSPTSIDVSPSGTLSFQIPADDQNVSTLNLYAWQNDDPSGAVAATLRIALSCPTEWFFDPAPDLCPTALRSSNAAEQRFEHGTMLRVEEFYWSNAPTANNRTIYVFFDDDPATDEAETYFRTFTDEWTDADPILDQQLIAPDGFYQPVRSLGKIWRDNPDIQARLGWAVDAEKAFVIAMQADSASQYPYLYLQTFDGGVRRLWSANYSWEALP